MKLVKGAVPFIRSGLGHQSNLSAWWAPLLGVGIGGRNAEFLNRIKGHAKHTSKCRLALLVIHIDAIKGYVALIALAPVDRAISIIASPALRVDVPKERHARLQAQQASHIASL